MALAKDKSTVLWNRYTTLKTARSAWEEHWGDIAKYVLPFREDIQWTQQKGQKRGTSIYDGTAPSALQLFANGLHGYLVSPSTVWFRMAMENRDLGKLTEVRIWLEEAQEAMYAAFNRSNFYEEILAHFEDGGSLGTAPLYVEEDIRRGTLFFNEAHPAYCYIAEDHLGAVDTCFRRVKLYNRQALQKFGKAVFNSQFLKEAEENPFSEKEYIHAVYPREEIAPGRAGSTNMPVASVWLSLNNDLASNDSKIISESGYNEMPYIVWRYRKSSNEVYGRSPASDAYAEIAGVNTMEKDILGASQLLSQPPMRIHADFKSGLNLLPRGRNYFTQKEQTIEPIFTSIDLPFTEGQLEQKRLAIERHFHVDFWLMLAQAKEREMTATEVIERSGEKAAILGAMVGRVNSETLNRCIDRVFNIEFRAGRLPEMPQVLMDFGGERIKVEYQGPLAQIQKRHYEVRGTQQALTELGPIAAVKPEVLDNFDWDYIARHAWDVNGALERAKLDPKVVAMARKVASEELARQEAAVSGERLLQGVKTLAEADAKSKGLVSLPTGGEA